ncbi:28803_t:CDS:2 [Dentiscutata erythropus]|uniref:28803_t:CDS:1 n=1 Tax=Dentiscutata erythropus TaxID=1348616 RepID=A0A9N9BF05_9GLOM|nr:28803_t:CDS:2 [Dentiscutata erythropus]
MLETSKMIEIFSVIKTLLLLNLKNDENISSQENTSSFVKNMSKKRNLAPMRTHNTNSKVINQDVRNFENNENISSQENTSTLIKNVSKKRNSAPSKHTKVIDQDDKNLKTDKQNIIPEDNVLSSLRNSLHSCIPKFNNIKSVSETFEDSAQESGT